MKKLLVLLFSIFFLLSPSVFADDISDFEIEGMSIGDSLLDYMTKDEILEGIEETKDRYPWLNEPYKYAQILLKKEFSTYDFVSIYIKNNSTNQYITDRSEKYTIESISGTISYIENFDGCIAKRNEIAEVLSKMFQEADKRNGTFISPADSSGDSFIDVIEFRFPLGAEIEVQCKNLEESFRIQKNWTEGLTIDISNKEVVKWISDTK